MNSIFFAALVFFGANITWSCPLPSSSFQCGGAAISDDGKIVLIDEIKISTDGLESQATWSGRSQDQNVQYVLNLTEGTQFVNDKSYTSSACANSPVGSQLYWTSFLRFPNLNDVYITRIKMTLSTDEKELYVIKENSGDSFKCQLK